MDHLWLEKGEQRGEQGGAGPKQATYGPDILGVVPIARTGVSVLAQPPLHGRRGGGKWSHHLTTWHIVVSMTAPPGFPSCLGVVAPIDLAVASLLRLLRSLWRSSCLVRW